MNIFIFLFFLCAFSFDIFSTGILYTQQFYFLYLASAYYFAFYTPAILPTAFMLLACALESFFITGIFGLWILHIVPILFTAQLSKNFIKNNYLLYIATFILLICGNYGMYVFYLKTVPDLTVLYKQLLYNGALLLGTSTLHYFTQDQS